MRTEEMLERAHNLLDRLEPSQLAVVVHLIEKFLNASDDTLSPSERLAVAEAEEWLRHNPPIPNADVLAEFGLTEADLERMAQEA